MMLGYRILKVVGRWTPEFRKKPLQRRQRGDDKQAQNLLYLYWISFRVGLKYVYFPRFGFHWYTGTFTPRGSSHLERVGVMPTDSILDSMTSP